jgi:hypothetical protein
MSTQALRAQTTSLIETLTAQIAAAEKRDIDPKIIAARQRQLDNAQALLDELPPTTTTEPSIEELAAAKAAETKRQREIDKRAQEILAADEASPEGEETKPEDALEVIAEIRGRK